MFEYFPYTAAYSKYINTVAPWKLKTVNVQDGSTDNVPLWACASPSTFLCLLTGCDFTHIPSVLYIGTK